MKKTKLEDESRILRIFVEDVLKKSDDKEKVLDRIKEFEIDFVTVNDIKAFMKKHSFDKKEIKNKDIISFLTDEKNREILQRFGQYKNPIDTRFNDYIYTRYKALDNDNYMEIC